MRRLNGNTSLNPWEIMRMRLRDRSVSSNARFLWALIDTYADKWGSHAFPSIKTLCKHSGKSRASIFRCLTELEKAGWLKRTKRFKKDGSHDSTLYILIYPVYRVKPESSPCVVFETGVVSL